MQQPPLHSQHGRARTDAFAADVDLQFHACSGARTYNVIPYQFPSDATPPTVPFAPEDLGLQRQYSTFGIGQYGELPQLDKGYVDADTDL